MSNVPSSEWCICSPKVEREGTQYPPKGSTPSWLPEWKLWWPDRLEIWPWSATDVQMETTTYASLVRWQNKEEGATIQNPIRASKCTATLVATSSIIYTDGRSAGCLHGVAKYISRACVCAWFRRVGIWHTYRSEEFRFTLWTLCLNGCKTGHFSDLNLDTWYQDTS